MSRSATPFMNGSTPTIVLVHGAFADSTSWSGVIAALQAVGVGVVAPALPLRGLAGDAEYVTSVIEQLDCPVILAGHCYGGAVITAVGARAANVVGLVYVTAFALEVGESCSDVAGRCRATTWWQPPTRRSTPARSASWPRGPAPIPSRSMPPHAIALSRPDAATEQIMNAAIATRA